MKKLWLTPFLAFVMWGADISGKWTGVIEVDDSSSGSSINTPVKAQFEEKSGAVTGTIGRTEDEQSEPIRNARLDGKKLIFEVQSPETTSAVKFNLEVVGEGRIEGEMK